MARSRGLGGAGRLGDAGGRSAVAAVVPATCKPERAAQPGLSDTDDSPATMPRVASIARCADDISVVHVDAACIVVVKPSGLLAVPGRGEHLQDCMAARLQGPFADALIVHRLDMSTSGLMVFARSLQVQRQLSLAFSQRTVRKRYIAVVHGRVVNASGEIDLPLGADWRRRRSDEPGCSAALRRPR